ncbi:type IV secretory system conjugative DNA transfer family protein [Bacillus songklensis]|uniref:Type IV secretory system conjugative DNA transfer family protein n=1 Tax=Bacillus songklensis TaxID=1069116 RepID=A0ABV8B0M1_9BACI
MSYLDAKILEGQSLLQLTPGTVMEKGKSDVGILGKDGTGIGMHPGLFSKHILTLGAIGSGKSNTMYHIVRAIRQKMDQNDVIVFFDAKGDYLEEFYEEGDYVISNSLVSPRGLVFWNIYKDILHTPKEKREETIREIASSLFKEDIENSQAPVFGMGARDLLAALLTIHVREIEDGKEQWDHSKLVAFLQSSNDVILRNLFLEHGDLKWVRNYIQKDGGSTTQSFLVHLYQTVYKIFSGAFGKSGDFSIREAVTKKGGKAIFLEYDLSSGNILEPVYTVLLDLAMKEVLGRSKTDGNVYFILDEFPLIPKLNYMDNALNFGRSLGVKVIAGIQNIGQVKHRYGDSLAYSILSGFGSIFAFRLFDEESRSFVSQRHGAAKRFISFVSTNIHKGTQDLLVDGKVIEDWDITKLNVGECIVSFPQGEPFMFYPVIYER